MKNGGVTEIKNLKEIELIFENVEVYKFKQEYFESIMIGNTFSEYGRFSENVLSKKFFSEICFTIFKGGNEESDTKHGEEELSRFERIVKFNDIVGINLIYEDGTEEEIHSYWMDGRNDEENKLQHSKITSRGDLKVYIGNQYGNTDDALYDEYAKNESDRVMRWREENASNRKIID